MERFNIADIANLFGIKQITEVAGEVYCVCPFCGNNKKKFSYVVSKGSKKNMFKCWSCESKGNAIDLYKKLSGNVYSDDKEGYKKVCRDIFKALDSDSAIEYHNKIIEKQVTVEESYKKSNEEISKVYYGMLKNLVLRDEHKKDLERRGVNEADIQRFRFRSTPTDPKGLCQKMIKQGFNLEGVPGFYVDKSGQWNFKVAGQGYLCPVYDGENNLIIGFQIRVDKPLDGNKYLWVSSAGKEKGVSSGAPSTFLPGKNEKTVIVAEGILKATVVYSLLNGSVSVIGVPGISCLDGLKEYLARFTNVCVYEAYDMDKVLKTEGIEDIKLIKKTKRIKDASEKLCQIIASYNLMVHPLRWDADKDGYWKENYKGLDDFLLEYKDREVFINYILEKTRKKTLINSFLKEAV